ncbi:MAG: hypothetical protein DRN00_04570 [Thermoplasmata archaeon]|nr:MAG: hypothetical protein DRN00_04570 [Thermoplasmata archaeon]
MEESYTMIILIAITITLAFITVYWLISIQSVTTEFEHLEVINQEVVEDNGYFKIKITIENKGIKKVSISNVLINGRTLDEYKSSITPQDIEIKPGEKTQVKIKLSKSEFDHGQLVHIKFISAKGNEFPILIYIP